MNLKTNLCLNCGLHGHAKCCRRCGSRPVRCGEYCTRRCETAQIADDVSSAAMERDHTEQGK